MFQGEEKIGRTLWYVDDLDTTRERLHDGRGQVEVSEANLISSLLTDGRHAPAIDFDVPIRLVPSSTSGHHHLYIEKPMTWRQYRILLRAFYKADLISYGYYIRSIQRQATFVRCPWILKTGGPKMGIKNFFIWCAVFFEAKAKLLRWNVSEFRNFLYSRFKKVLP